MDLTSNGAKITELEGSRLPFVDLGLADNLTSL